MNKEGMERVGISNKTKEVFNHSEKPLRYSQDSFVKELIGKKIRICLTNNEIFDGTLKQLGMYDILLSVSISEKIMISGKEMTRDTQKDRIFMKSSIVWVEVQ
jgi:small nuclear ribonucleoprotein (snRNP)-like protein